MRRWRSIILAGCPVLAAVVVWRVAAAYRRFTDWSADAYGSMQVAMWIIDHLESNDGRRPRGWDDLRQWRNKRTGSQGDDEYWAELQRRIEVDWGADPAALVLADEQNVPPFHVVRCRSGRRGGPIEDHEPNRMILMYLRARQRDSRSETSPAKAPTTRVPAVWKSGRGDTQDGSRTRIEELPLTGPV